MISQLSRRQHDLPVYGGSTIWPAARHCCHETCVEVEREAVTANQLRALVARMVEFVPADHPLAAEARDILE